MASHASPVDAGGRHRSGAVARMLRMPVATLRVWERRYGLTQPALSPSGQRLYSADDVRRLALLKQLVDAGHAIGSLAPLDMAQLQQVAATHASALAARPIALQPGPLAAAAPVANAARVLRVQVVGGALFQRLQQPALQRRLGRPVQWLGPFDDLAQADADRPRQPADAVLMQQPRLHADAAPSTTRPCALLYRFAAETTAAAWADAGVWLLREPQSDTVLAQWLAAWCGSLAGPAPSAAAVAGGWDDPAAASTPRRWDDEALAEFAGLSTTIACECPRHVAELLMQLSHFEAYSAECEHRSPEDAELHRGLRHMAATARARFEAALEHVARHEGLLLPP
ncbi:MAG: MerR family transcriptional regulator [Aquincola tertiaricarbonis]